MFDCAPCPLTSYMIYFAPPACPYVCVRLFACKAQPLCVLKKCMFKRLTVAMSSSDHSDPLQRSTSRHLQGSIPCTVATIDFSDFCKIPLIDLLQRTTHRTFATVHSLRHCKDRLARHLIHLLQCTPYTPWTVAKTIP